MPSGDLKIALRTLYREKTYAAINVAGLSLGMACCLILGLYLEHELTYDRHHENHARIFRVVNDFVTNGLLDDYALTSAGLGPLLVDEFAEVEDYVRFRMNPQIVQMRFEDQAFDWDADMVYIADSNVFEVFTHEILYGDPATALEEPFNIAVSETFATRYFGDENPLGRTVVNERGEPHEIALVFRDLPENTHLRYDLLFSYERDGVDIPAEQRALLLGAVSDYTYLLMPQGYAPESFETISDSVFERHLEQRFNAANVVWRAWLQPLAGIHLNSNLNIDLPTGNKDYVYGFAAVAVFVLLVACINYMNLATARSAKRAQEVGMRKILGANRGALIGQFLGESMVYAMIAMVIALGLVELALTLTPISELLGTDLALDLLQGPL